MHFQANRKVHIPVRVGGPEYEVVTGERPTLNLFMDKGDSNTVKIGQKEHESRHVGTGEERMCREGLTKKAVNSARRS